MTDGIVVPLPESTSLSDAVKDAVKKAEKTVAKKNPTAKRSRKYGAGAEAKKSKSNKERGYRIKRQQRTAAKGRRKMNPRPGMTISKFAHWLGKPEAEVDTQKQKLEYLNQAAEWEDYGVVTPTELRDAQAIVRAQNPGKRKSNPDDIWSDEITRAQATALKAWGKQHPEADVEYLRALLKWHDQHYDSTPKHATMAASRIGYTLGRSGSGIPTWFPRLGATLHDHAKEERKSGLRDSGRSPNPKGRTKKKAAKKKAAKRNPTPEKKWVWISPDSKRATGTSRRWIFKPKQAKKSDTFWVVTDLGDYFSLKRLRQGGGAGFEDYYPGVPKKSGVRIMKSVVSLTESSPRLLALGLPYDPGPASDKLRGPNPKKKATKKNPNGNAVTAIVFKVGQKPKKVKSEWSAIEIAATVGGTKREFVPLGGDSGYIIFAKKPLEHENERNDEATTTAGKKGHRPEIFGTAVLVPPSHRDEAFNASIGRQSRYGESPTERNPPKKKATKKKATKKKVTRKAKPEWQKLIDKCRKLWDHYCERPSKARLKPVLEHLEKMKASTSKKVADERKSCLRVANKEARRLKLK